MLEEQNVFGGRSRAEQARARYLLGRAGHEAYPLPSKKADAGDAEDGDEKPDMVEEENDSPEPVPQVPHTHPGRRNGPPILERPAKPGFRDRIGDRTRNVFSSKWLRIAIGVVAVIVILVIAILFLGNSNPGTTYYAPTTQPQPEQAIQTAPAPVPAQQWSAPPITVQPRGPQSLSTLNVTIYLLSLAIVTLGIFSLLESAARGDKVLLDFFAAWGLIALFVIGQIYGNYATWSWGFWFGVAMLGMVLATIWNPSEENEPKWWNKIDTTHWYVVGVVLIILYLMNSPAVPYPTYVPILVPIFVAIVGAGKEIFRQVTYSLVAIAIAIVPAVLQSPTALALGLAVEIGIAAAAHHQGYVTTRGTNHDLNIGGRSITIVLDWDIVLFYITVVALLGYALYGNYPVITIVR